MFRSRRIRPGARWLTVSVLATAIVGSIAVGLAWGGHNDAGTVHVCVAAGGRIRHTTEGCLGHEQEYILATEAGVAALRAALEAADAGHDARLDALEATDGTHAGRLRALEATDTAHGGRIDSLEAADADLDARLDALESTDVHLQARIDSLESRIAALELATTPTDVVFTKIFDGGHYASYSITGQGFRPGTEATSGVGTTATVADDGTFELFGGNLFCDRQVSVSGTSKDGSSFSRSQEVQCDSEPATTPSVNFIKIHDGGHYASYNITGEGFRPGTQVTSGVGTTVTVASNGTFELFGGNLFCDREVYVSGTANDGSPFTRAAPVECDSES